MRIDWASRIILGAVDTQAGRQALQGHRQLALGSGQVALGVERGNVGIDDQSHFSSP